MVWWVAWLKVTAYAIVFGSRILYLVCGSGECFIQIVRWTLDWFFIRSQLGSNIRAKQVCKWQCFISYVQRSLGKNEVECTCFRQFFPQPPPPPTKPRSFLQQFTAGENVQMAGLRVSLFCSWSSETQQRVQHVIDRLNIGGEVFYFNIRFVSQCVSQ